MKLCANCQFCETHCQCTYPQWSEKVNYCCEKCEVVDSRIAELEAQLAAAQAELSRLRSGGCAREQGATQWCGEAATWSNTASRYAEHIAKMDIRLEEARELLLQAHEPDQGQLRTQWDKDVDEWIKKAAQAAEKIRS